MSHLYFRSVFLEEKDGKSSF